MSLELQNVGKQVIEETHIAPTSLKMKPGVFNILLGPTLSGKTSLMRLMAGLDKPTSGRIFFEGVDITELPVQKRNVAMVYQQFINYPNMTVFDNIASPLRVQVLPETEVMDKVGMVAKLLKLTPFLLKRRPRELSGGQQQRVALARALVKNAKLVLLDEPLVNLDYKLREELREELPQLFLDTGATVIYATTEPLEALLLGGYTANMREGKVTQYAPTHQVFRKPMDLDTAKGFSDPPMNTIDVQKNGNGFLLENQGRWEMPRFASIPDGTYTLGFRPHHLQLSASDKNYVKLSGEVLVTEISGSESFIHLRSVQHDKWSAQIHGIHDLEQGVQIELFLSLKHCLLFDGAGQRVDVN